MCQKVKHGSREKAMIALKRINNKSLLPYLCDQCKKWHLGHNRDMSHLRIEQLLKEHEKSVKEKSNGAVLRR